jgi:hypothetical protein
MITGRYPCGFCASGAHHLCPGTIAGGVPVDAQNPGSADRVWQCPCSAREHSDGTQAA